MNKKEQDQLDALIAENAALKTEIADLNTSVAALVDEMPILTAENAALKTELAALKSAPAASEGVQLADAANAFQTRYAKEIKAKIAAGLDRAQAIEAQEAQVRADALFDSEAKAAAKK